MPRFHRLSWVHAMLGPVGLAALTAFSGCASGSRSRTTSLGVVDPVDAFIAKMDAAPAEQRLADWATTRRLMARAAPRVGEAAPDFTLYSPDGGVQVKRSKHHLDRPLVLVFGSFT